jgi:uncharacterized protein (DUF1330 family)
LPHFFFTEGKIPEEGEMAAYVVVNLTVNDPEMFEQYRSTVVPLVLNSGGKYLVVDFEPMDLDGQSRPGLAVVEFESVEAAQRFYNSPEYQAVVGLRLSSTEGWLRVAPQFTMPTT